MTRIGLIQTKCSENQKDNIDKIEQLIYKAASQNAKIISLQELATTKYLAHKQNIDYFKFAEENSGNSIAMAEKLAKNLKIYLLLPYFEKDITTYYNSVIVFSPEGKVIGKYRKTHIPQNTSYQEKYYFKPGNIEYPIFHTEYGNFGISTCWDHWFPEVQRIYGLKGADIVFSPTSIGYNYSPECYIDHDYKKTWQAMLVGQAITSGFYFAIINRTGKEDEIDFYGSSFIISPKGKIVASLNEEEENCLVQEIDINEARNWKVMLQFNRDRRTELYKSLVE